MNNALDYLEWRGDLSIEAAPLGEVDLFICSQLATPDYSGIVHGIDAPIPIPEVSARFFENNEMDVSVLGVLQSECVLPMLSVLPKYPRFATASLGGYVLKVDRALEEQFSAVTVCFPDGSVCVSYQGTDDSLVGWKENFNFAVCDFVPAQKDAALYLEKIAKATAGKIYVVGHSKGGNLAVYAAAHATKKTQKRLVRVISFDGPGFQDGFFEQKGYLAIADRVFTILSQNAMVGVLLNTAGERVIVKGNKKGPIAHDGFTWEVKGDRFVRCSSFSKESRFFDRTMDSLLRGLAPQERVDFIGGLFDALYATGATTITDLKKLKFNQVILIIYRFSMKKRLSKTISIALDAIFHQERNIKKLRNAPIGDGSLAAPVSRIEAAEAHVPSPRLPARRAPVAKLPQAKKASVKRQTPRAGQTLAKKSPSTPKTPKKQPSPPPTSAKVGENAPERKNYRKENV